MSQHDMTLDNASGLGFRSDANNALQALASQSSGASSPSPTFPCQVWGDTSTGRLKQRNAANTAWLDKGPLDSPLRDAASQGEYAADTGAAGAYVCNFVPALTARSESTPLRFKAANANPGACTINDGLGTVALVGGAHSALQGGEIIANGIAWIQWNASIGGGSYVLLFCTGAPEQVAPATKGQHAVQLQQMAAVVGGIRNGRMSVTAASATATFTADEVAVKAALGGASWLLSSFSKNINLATTGAGGMDTGTAPVSGYVALYAIYNPTTATSALLATNATAAAAPEVYGGANMPSGYTASALLTVLPTNASSQLKICIVQDREVFIPLTTIFQNNSSVTNQVASIAGVIPKNARSIFGQLFMSSSTTSSLNFAIQPDTTTIAQVAQSVVVGGSAGLITSFPRMALAVAQQIVINSSSSAGTPTFIVYGTGYSI